jgi:hypothetical protein
MNDTELDQLLDTWQAPVPSQSLRRTTLAALPPRPPRRVFGLPLRWVVAAALSAGGFAIGTSIWSNPEIGRFYGETDSLYMRGTRLVDPPTAVIRWWSKGAGHSVGDTPNGGMRNSGYLRDRGAGKVYGYRYTAEPVAGGNYQITFAPYNPAALHDGPFKIDAQVVQGAPLPAPKIIRDGDTFDVDLYADGHDRVFDRIQISSHPFAEELKRPQTREQEQWEAMKMKLERPRVFVDALFAGEDGSSARGVCVWVYFPGEGRYLITLNAEHNPRFVQAGHVNSNTLEFASNNKHFRIETATPIATGADRPVYVYHQQSFEDEINSDYPGTRRMMTGSAGPASMQK